MAARLLDASRNAVALPRRASRGFGDAAVSRSETRKIYRVGFSTTVDSRKLEHGGGMICAGVPSFCGLGLKDGHVPPSARLLLFMFSQASYYYQTLLVEGPVREEVH